MGPFPSSLIPQDHEHLGSLHVSPAKNCEPAGQRLGPLAHTAFTRPSSCFCVVVQAAGFLIFASVMTFVDPPIDITTGEVILPIPVVLSAVYIMYAFDSVSCIFSTNKSSSRSD